MAQRGFTLIELMIVTIVLGLVMAIAIPSTASFRQSLALRQARSQLYSDLRMARQLAVTRRAPVYVRFANGSTTTNVTTYQFHVDTNHDRVIQSTEPVVQRTMPAKTKIANISLSPVDTVTFDISGILLPGQLGGRLILRNDKNKRDTLYVSAAGLVYRQ
jgi:type II secretion system protein H